MSLLFETGYTEGLAQISYVVGDTKAGVGATIDPGSMCRFTSISLSRKGSASCIWSRPIFTPTS